MKKILVIQTASIGDVILATALPEKLHTFFPDARIDLLVKTGMESLFTDHPFIHHLYCWDKSRKFRDVVRLIREVRALSYDLVINLQRFALTGWLTVASGARETRGFDKNPFSRFYTHRYPHPIGNGIHETERNQQLIADLTGTTPARPRLYPEKRRETASGRRHPGSEIIYTISPASLWFTKQFPADRWAELICLMPSSATLFLLGSATDRPLCDHIIDLVQTNHQPETNLPRMENLAGTLTLLDSAALMQQARMNFTNDSAPMHLASAVNAPVCTIYCSTTPDLGFGPLSDQSGIIQIREVLSCRPCNIHGKRFCPEHHFACARSIVITEVLDYL